MRIRLAAVLGACALVGLTGCGSSLSPDLHPGRAAVVGDQEITIADVDSHADALCEASRAQLAQSGAALSMASMRNEYLTVLTQESLARQYVEATDLDIRADYRAALKSLDQQLADPQNGVAPDQVDALRDYNSRIMYVQTVQRSLAGADSEAPSQAPSQADLDAGQQKLDEWAAAEGITTSTDPRFDLAGDGSTSLTVPVSDLAKLASTPERDEGAQQAYLDALPASQKCG